ncbi:MAG: hypothetical protein FJ276_32415, partial [Planctomycetes bacterium]|nr:hypothetical protein [Planctomycetota bacterium]
MARVLACLTAWLVGAAVTPGRTFADFHDSFETPETSWQLADRDCHVRVTRHARVFDEAHSGQASERLQLQTAAGSFVHFVYRLPKSPLIDELSIEMWLKANRPGLQLAVRVVLPRSTDPHTGKALTTLIRAAPYQRVDAWEKLSIQSPSQALQRQLPLLRSQFGSQVDAREAYVDLLVLNAHGGVGVTEFWIDDLNIVGLVSTGSSPDASLPAVEEPSAALVPSGAPAKAAETGMQSSRFLVGGRARLVRAIDYNGEPLAWLKSLGFNAVRLAVPATPEQLREAEAHDLWFIAPPPLNQSPLEYGTLLQRIMAWDLGENLTADQLEPVRELADRLRQAAGAERRAAICLPREATWQYSRIADVLVLEPPGPNSSLPLDQYAAWYRQRLQLAQLGTQFWTSVPTQVSSGLMEQMAAMGMDGAETLSLEPEQIRLLAYHAIASGARGLLFRSRSRLDESDRATLLRLRTLQLLNLELQMLEPWAATGTCDGDVDVGDPTARVSVLQIDRSRLLLVIRRAPDQQYVAHVGSDRGVAFEFHGMPATDEAYRIAADGLHRIRQQRNSGLEITLGPGQMVETVLLSQDRLAINFLARQINATRRQ